MFNKVLIANRGEIAVRIAQTLQQMGVTAVAVFSDADRAAMHVGAADEAYPLEGTTSVETYLDAPKIIDIARRNHVEAIHPGYGFLAENAAFAQACQDAGIVFVGPTPEVIRAMGDKLTAKKLFADAGVPVVPGWSGEGVLDASRLRKEAKRMGYPLLIKAAAGGGGKGMRVAKKEDELQAAIEAAQREAGAAFGDDRVFLEKYLPRPRHVEVQIFGDTQGNVVHLFERECSIQRRHQKIVEETPSPALTPELSQRICDAAVKVAKAIGYVNAGTVEFLVTESGEFYFLEVNTRLQVEHPVTEMTVRHDLVRAQLMVAAGNSLPFTQEGIQPVGHAIEARIYAEDADRGFLPSTGRIERYVPPVGPNIRVDSAIMEGSEVTSYYDPMLAKLVVWGRSRDETVARLQWALAHYVILGVTTNITFLLSLVDHPEFRSGRLHTHFLDDHRLGAPRGDLAPEDWMVAARTAAQCDSTTREFTAAPAAGAGDGETPWRLGRAWRAF